MTRSSASRTRPVRSAAVVPLRGSVAYAASSLLVRARLRGDMGEARTRAAVAFFAEACDLAREKHGAESRWWTMPTGLQVERVAEGALLGLADAELALRDLEDAGLLVSAEQGHRIDAEALCECVALASFDLAAARRRILEQGRYPGPATAVLRELLRLADAAGIARVTIPRLIDASLYGRTRLSQSLAALESAGLLDRSDLPSRMVQFRLLDPSALAALPPAPPQRSTREPSVAPGVAGVRMRLPTGVPLEIGGVPLEVSPGIVPELERASDGRYYLWLGPVRIGPYEG